MLACALVAAVLAALAPETRAAERVCGTVWSSGAPVRGAHVVATERGLVATTDSSGAFCFESVEPGTVSLLAAAMGFQTAERLVSVQAGMTPVHFELVPLRGPTVGSALGGAAAAPPGASVPMPAAGTEAAPPPAPAEPAPSGPAAALLAEVPVLVLPADSEWLAAKHKGENWSTLRALHATLTTGANVREPLDAKSWRAVRGRVHDLYVDECTSEGPRKRALGADACAYLERALALTDVRAALLGGGGVTHDTRVYLQQQAGSRDPAVAGWARALLERAAKPRAERQPPTPASTK
jgi:hypothetical protein